MAPRPQRRGALVGPLEALPEGQVRRVVYSEKAGDELRGGVLPDEDLIWGISKGSLTLYEKDGVARVVRSMDEDEELPMGQGPEEDIRVLPVRWTGGRRRRPFKEAVEMMEFHDFGDSPLEAEPSLRWYLQELVQAGETPTTRRGGPERGPQRARALLHLAGD